MKISTKPKKEPVRKSELSSAERRHEMSSVELLILQAAEYLDEGNNGIVLRLNLSGASDENLRALINIGLITKEDLVLLGQGDKQAALKLLKIYKPGFGKQEAKMQATAYSIIDDATKKNPGKKYAKIPKMMGFSDLEFTEKGRNDLENLGIKTGPQNSALMMDLVAGKDLARIIFESILKLSPESNITATDASAMSMPELTERVQRLLGFTRPSEKIRNQGDAQAAQMKMESENAKKITDFLRRKNFTLPKSIYESLQNTILELTKNKFHHQDLHHRNVMISGLENGEDCQVYVIDYGSATVGEKDPDRPEFDILNFLKPFIFTEAELAKKGSGEFLKTLLTQLKKQGAEVGLFTKKMPAAKSVQELNDLAKSIPYAYANSRGYELIAIHLISQKLLPKEIVLGWLEQLSKKDKNLAQDMEKFKLAVDEI